MRLFLEHLHPRSEEAEERALRTTRAVEKTDEIEQRMKLMRIRIDSQRPRESK